MNAIGRNYRAFFRAVIAGSLAAAFPGLLFFVIIGLSMLFDFEDPNGGLRALPIMLAPLIVSFPCVLAGSLICGLPVTALLNHLNRERGEYYVLLGLAFGALPFIALMVMVESGGGFGILAVLGALGGGVAGWVWGRHRDDLHGLSPWR